MIQIVYRTRFFIESSVPRFPEGLSDPILFVYSYRGQQCLPLISKQKIDYCPTCSNGYQHVPFFHDIFAHIKACSSFWFVFAPCRGWAHFLLVLHIRPSSARCLGQIVLVAPSSLKKPTRARIKSFSVDTVVWDTLTCLR